MMAELYAQINLKLYDVLAAEAPPAPPTGLKDFAPTGPNLSAWSALRSPAQFIGGLLLGLGAVIAFFVCIFCLVKLTWTKDEEESDRTQKRAARSGILALVLGLGSGGLISFGLGLAQDIFNRFGT